MKYIICFCFVIISFCDCCYAQQRLESGLSAIIGSVIRQAGASLSGGTFDETKLRNEAVYAGSTELQHSVYDRYYENIRERHRKEALDREYEAWAIREDAKNGVPTREDYFRRRYYGR